MIELTDVEREFLDKLLSNKQIAFPLDDAAIGLAIRNKIRALPVKAT